MSIVISGSTIPGEIIMEITNFLDARSQASYSQVCKLFRETINDTKGHRYLPNLGFTLYLTNELFLAGQYKHGLKNKSDRECEIFKANVGNLWFAAMNGTGVITDGLLTIAIGRLAAKRAWTDAKIKKLCGIFNYEATKEMPDFPHSWRVISKH